MSHVPLENVLTSLESGSRPSGGVTSESGEIPSLGAEHLTDQGGFNFSSIKRIPRPRICRTIYSDLFDSTM